jgi:hypothetical protein
MFLLPPQRRLSPKAIETIMEEARTKWVGLMRAYQIEREIKLDLCMQHWHKHQRTGGTQNIAPGRVGLRLYSARQHEQ